MATTYWRGVGVAIESARAAADTITGITKANPGVVTAASHGFSNGDYIYHEVQGMWQMDGRVARVTGAATDTYNLEGITTTTFDTFTSGSAYKLTLGTTLATVTNVTASGGEPEYADATTIHMVVRERAPVLASPVSFSMESIWDPADAGLVALKSASDTLAAKGILLTFSNSYKLAFVGYVSCSMVPTGSFGELVKTPITFEARGYLTAYTT